MYCLLFPFVSMFFNAKGNLSIERCTFAVFLPGSDLFVHFISSPVIVALQLCCALQLFKLASVVDMVVQENWSTKHVLREVGDIKFCCFSVLFCIN